MNNKLFLNLIRTLPKLDSVDDNGNNLLHNLARYGNKDYLKTLIKQTSFNWKSLINQRNEDGYTPLHLAVISKNQNIINDLIKLGANKNIPTLTGQVVSIKNNKSQNKIQKGGGEKKKITGTRSL